MTSAASNLEAGRRKPAAPKLSEEVQAAAVLSMQALSEAKERAARAARDRRANQCRVAEETAELEQLQAEEADEAIRQLVDGSADPASDDARRQRIADLLKLVPASRGADSTYAERIEACSARVADLTAPHTAAMIGVVRDIQDPALAAVREGLEALRPHLIALVAADLIREQTVGDAFFLASDAAPPFAGSTIVRKFLTSLPVRFRSSTLDLGSIRLVAGNTATRITASLEENAK